ncbi:MAG: hypothetical protein JSR76_00050 [Verrucomicrobia bacterium]|nr:hypothetical protein [Verrucomicrobiota bacterium]
MQKVLQFIRPYRSWFIGSFLLFGLVTLFFVRLGMKDKCFVQEYVEADALYSHLAKGKADGVKKLHRFAAKYPTLQPFFYHALYQFFLLRGDVEEAKKISLESLKRATLENHYRSYALTSITIAEGKLEEALHDALLLQEKLEKVDFQQYQRLHAFNILRMSYLENRLGLKETHKDALKTLLDKENKRLSPKVKEELYAHLHEGNLFLLDGVK